MPAPYSNTTLPPPPSSPYTNANLPPPPSSPYTNTNLPPPPSSPYSNATLPPPPSSLYSNANLPPPPSSPFENVHLPLPSPSCRFSLSNRPKLSVSSPPPSYSPPPLDDSTPAPSNPARVLHYSPLADYRIPKRFLLSEFASPCENTASTPKPPNGPSPLACRDSQLHISNPNENDDDSLFIENFPQKESSIGTSSLVANSPAFLSANSPFFHSFNTPLTRNNYHRLMSTDWSPNYSHLGFSPITNLSSTTTKDPSTSCAPNPSQYLATDTRIPPRFLTGSNLRHAHHLMGSSPNVKLQAETLNAVARSINRDVPRNHLGEAIEEEKLWFNDGRIPDRFLQRKEQSSQIHQGSLSWLENNKPRNNKDSEEDIKDRKRTKEEVARIVPRRFLKTNESLMEKNERNEMQEIFQRIPLRFLEAGTGANLRIPRRYLRQGQMNKKHNKKNNRSDKNDENFIFINKQKKSMNYYFLCNS